MRQPGWKDWPAPRQSGAEHPDCDSPERLRVATHAPPVADREILRVPGLRCNTAPEPSGAACHSDIHPAGHYHRRSQPLSECSLPWWDLLNLGPADIAVPAGLTP